MIHECAELRDRAPVFRNRRDAGRVLAELLDARIRAVRDLAARVDDVFCANLRTGSSFAVADAYEEWRDVPEVEAVELLSSVRE